MSDSLQPNPLEVTPGGVIIATGLDLPAGIVGQTPGPQNTIQWTRAADGAVVASIIGEGPQTSSAAVKRTTLLLQALAPDTPGTGASLTLAGNTVAGGGGGDYVQASAAGNFVNIIDDAGNSSFLKLLNNGAGRLAFGYGYGLWNNGSPFSPTFQQPHGLGAIPSFAGAISSTGSGISYTVSVDATYIYLAGYYGPGGGLNQGVNFYWWAIG